MGDRIVTVRKQPVVVRLGGVAGPPSGVREELAAIAPVAGVLTIPADLSSFRVVLDQQVDTVEVANPPGEGRISYLAMRLEQDAVGGHAVGWPTDWFSGIPELSINPLSADWIWLAVWTDSGVTHVDASANTGFVA